MPSGQNYAYFDVIGSTSSFSTTQINQPYGTYVDSSDNIYIADYNNYLVRMLSSSGTLTTFAGNGGTGSTTIGSNQQATATAMQPMSIAGDGTNIYITAHNSCSILKVRSEGSPRMWRAL